MLYVVYIIIISTFGLMSINRRGSNFSVIIYSIFSKENENKCYLYISRFFFSIIVTFIFNLHESSNAFNGASWGVGGGASLPLFLAENTYM